MALPGNYDTETITGQRLNLDGTAAIGTITFSPQLTSGTFLQDTSVPVTLVPNNFVATPDGTTGNFSITLPSTDDPDITPSGWTYKVTEQFGANVRTYFIFVEAGGGPYKLDLKAPVSSVVASVSLVRTVNGSVPDVNGNVTVAVTGAYPLQSFGVGPTAYPFTPVGVGSGYFIVDKTGNGNDASTLYRSNGVYLAEVGTPADIDFHVKVIPDGVNFIDGIIVKNAAPNTGKVFIPVGLGVGTIPVELFHVAADETSTRTTAKIENTNAAGTGSVGSEIELAGHNVTWVLATDVGLNGGNNVCLVNANGAYMTGFSVNSAGQMGILTDSPGSALDVAGAVTVRGDNGLSPIRIRGRQTTVGHPITGTWAVGDVVMDSAKTLWLCTIAGTSGTWV